MYAHIYKGRHGWEVIVTSGPSIVGSTAAAHFASKAEAKAWAKVNNLKPYNY